MPNYKGHIAGAVITFVIVLYLLIGLSSSLSRAFEFLFFTVAGALFPDIDIKSKGQKYFYYAVFLFFIILAIKKRFEIMSGLSFIIITPMLVRHRGVFHSPRFVIMIPLIAWIIVSMLFPAVSQRFLYDILFFIAGALSHIWLDLGMSHMMGKLFRKKKKLW